MNLAVAFVIISCLMVTELSHDQPVDDVWSHVGLVLAMMFAVPGVALFQTWIISRRHSQTTLSYKGQQTLLNRLSVCHTAIWLCSSLGIIIAARWHDVVRTHWQFSDWVLLDELMILAPILFSIVASWAVFYEIEKVFSRPEDLRKSGTIRSFLNDWKSRLAFVSIRFRVNVLMVLAPLLIVVLAKDLIPSGPPSNVIAFGFTFAAIMAVVFPFLILMIWNTEPLRDTVLKQELLELCQKHRIGVRSIRVWKTDRQILNAAIIGLIPGTRYIILTDTMLDRFSKAELRAVIRHEAGHIRMNHFARRLGGILLPLVLLFIDQQLSFGLHAILENRLTQLGQSLQWATGFISCLYIGYLWMISSLLFKKMEFEADVYSVRIPEEGISVCEARANDLISALQKFAAYCPSQFENGSGLHPSLRSRIALISNLADPTPSSADWSAKAN